MRENQKLDDGSIQIHKKVLADIILSVVRETDGVRLVNQSFLSKFARLLKRNIFSGISVFIDKENDVSIEASISVRYGVNIPDISRQLQESIREAIEKTTDIQLKDVHINVQQIEGGA
jgi:uncharacterized alkaline shock family protein YloU